MRKRAQRMSIFKRNSINSNVQQNLPNCALGALGERERKREREKEREREREMQRERKRERETDVTSP